MSNPKSMFYNIVKYYVTSHLNSKENNLSDSEKIGIEQGIRSEVLKEVHGMLGRDLLDKAKEDANKAKRKIVKKFKITLIIETLFIGFLIGIIVNQVTNLIPRCTHISLAVIIIAFLACVLMVHLGLGKN